MFDRVVHSSTGFAAAGSAPLSSYDPSLCSHRLSGGQDVHRGVHVTVMPCTAFGAIPLSDVQGQIINDMPAVETPLAGWEEAVHDFYFLAVPGALVINHAPEFTHADIGNCPGKTMVCQHPADVEIFDGDYIEAPHKTRRQLVQEIHSCIRDMLLKKSNPEANTLPPSTALLSSSHDTLESFQFAERTIKPARIVDLLSRGQSCEAADAEVDADFLSGLRQFLDLFVEAERNEIAPRRFLAYRNRRGFASERPAPTNLEPAETGDIQITIVCVPFEGTAGILCGLRPSLFLERRISAELIEEPSKGSLKVTKRLLDRNAGYIIQPSRILLLLHICEHGRGLTISYAFLFLIPGINAKAEKIVVDEAAGAEYAGKHGDLGFRGINAESAVQLHKIIYNIVTSTCQTLHQRKDGAPPSPKGGGLRAEVS